LFTKKYRYQYLLLAVLLFFLMLMPTYTSGAASQTPDAVQTCLFHSNQLPSVACYASASEDIAHRLVEERHRQEKQMSAQDNSQEIIVKWKKPLDKESREALLKLCAAENIHEQRDLSLLRVKDRERAIAELKQSGDVEYVEPNYPLYMEQIPNDPLYSQQWGLHQINAARVWDKLTPNQKAVIVAVVDSGICFDHEDMQGRITYTGAWDFVLNDSYPLDLDGHGTAVAGIIAAVTDNHTGIAGTSGLLNVQILPLKIFNSLGKTNAYLISQAIIHAADHGAQVINLSLSGSLYSQAVSDAVDYAWERGAVLVAAAGNNRGPVSYPAALPKVIAVAASNEGDQVASFSNHGPEVMVAAPGEDILTTDPQCPYYKICNGTSMAAPFVSAAAAIIKSQLPAAGPEQVAEIIKKGVVDIGPPGKDDYSGYGRLDLELVAAQLVDAGNPTDGETDRDIDDQVKRIEGLNRYETSARTALEAYKSGTDTVILARGDDNLNGQDDFADGLAASYLAGLRNAPILLTQSDSLPLSVREAINTLGATKAVILGGPRVISEQVEQDLKRLGKMQEVKRIFGDDRYKTAAKIAAEGGPVDTAIVVSGTAPADSLVAGPYAFSKKHPVLLVDKNNVHDAITAITDLGIKNINVIGGEGVVSKEIYSKMENIVGADHTWRYSGENRMETSLDVAGNLYNNPVDFSIVGYHGLADAVGAAVFKNPILYVLRDDISGIEDYLKDRVSVDSQLIIFGGEARISGEVETALEAMLDDLPRGRFLWLAHLLPASYRLPPGFCRIWPSGRRLKTVPLDHCTVSQWP
jgi:subtilisin family serine protease